MSDYVPVPYTKKQQANNWINIVYATHDQFCGCLQPIIHLNKIIENQKCRHTTDAATTTEETGGTHETDEINIDEGDLEELFKQSDDPDG